MVATNEIKAAAGRKQRTWTFQPDDNAASLLAKAVTALRKEARKRGVEFSERGVRTRLINEALRAQFIHLKGKREA